MNWLLLIVAVLQITVVRAQANVCNQATATIISQADATAYASCSTISGSVLVSSEALAEISLDGPSSITGDLDVNNAGGLTSLSSATISTIGGTFNLQNLTTLSTLQFNELTNVKTILWIALPALAEITFPNGPIEAQSITISNTYLSSLDDFATGVTSTVNINNNNYLTTANLTVSSVTTALSFTSNGNRAQLSLPNLIWAANITAENCSQLSLPSMTVVNGTFGLYGNSFSSFTAPKMKSVGAFANGEGSLIISSNTALGNLSMPLLSSVGDVLQISGNTVLQAISLPALMDVGMISLIGNFSTPSLNALSTVKDGFDLESNNTSVDCSGFQKEAASGVIQGTFVCQSYSSTVMASSPTSTNSATSGALTSSAPTSSGTAATNSSTSKPGPASGSGLSTGAKVGIGVAIPLVVIILSAIVFAWKMGYKLSLQRTAKPQVPEQPHPTEAELPQGGHHEKTELPAKVEALQKPSELSANSRGPVPEAHELYSNERYEAEG